MRTLASLFTVAIALVGCKTNKHDKPATTGSAAVAGSGSAGRAAVGSDAVVGQGEPLKLYKGDGTPPKKSTRPLDQALVDTLGNLEFPTFTKQDRTAGKAFEARFTTPRPKLATTVTITKCFDCLPMELEKWQAKGDKLKALLAEELRDLPDTKFEVGKTELHGQPLIYLYQVGYINGKDAQGQPQGAYSNAYVLYFNDGVNQVRVVSEYKDDWVTREDMLAIAPRGDLEKIAKSFMDAFTHAW